MIRPCFILADVEHAGSVSTRKLVVETAKMNVITVYSGAEAIETLGRYPNVDGVVLDAGMGDIPCSDLLKRLRKLSPAMPLIVVDRPGAPRCDGADYQVRSFAPAEILKLLQSLTPEQTRAIERRNLDLAEEELQKEMPAEQDA